MSLWFTSDTHFGHKNVIKYCNRPFQTVEEMDEVLIKNWNSRICPNDVVYHLGDVAFRSVEETNAILKRLNGKKILIRGNHDKKINSSLFEGVYNYYELKVQDKFIVMCHYAMRVWNKSHHGSYHLYGHSHGTLPQHGLSMDVGVDANEFKPISFEEIKLVMEHRKAEGFVNTVSSGKN